MSSLVVYSPEGERTFVEIDRYPFTIGRQPDSALVLYDQRISRSHAHVIQSDEGLRIEDLESRHGLFINGTRVENHLLRAGDLIEFGIGNSYQLQFVAEPGAALPDPFSRLREVLEIARSFERTSSPHVVLESVVDAALRIIGAERGFLFQRRGGALEMLASRDDRGSPLTEESLRVPKRLIEEALDTRREAFAMNFEGDDGIDPGQTVVMLELRSSVFVPLPRTHGLLYFDSRAERANLAMGNRELLETLALEASAAIENARSLEEERHRRKLEEELSIARVIQQNLLPKELPKDGWIRAAGSSRPSRAVGGDYYDVLTLDPDRRGIVMADVSGKGVSAALLASLLQGAILTNGDSIDGLFSRLNRFLLDRTGGEKYATMFYAILDRTGMLTYANAGQCPPLLVRADGSVEELNATGVPIGLIEGAEHAMEQKMLFPGDKLVAFSDGFAESLPVSMVGKLSHLGAAEIQAELLKRCVPEAPEDDETLLVVEFSPD